MLNQCPDKENATPSKPISQLQSPFTFGKRPRKPTRNRWSSENDPVARRPEKLFKHAAPPMRVFGLFGEVRDLNVDETTANSDSTEKIMPAKVITECPDAPRPFKQKMVLPRGLKFELKSNTYWEHAQK